MKTKTVTLRYTTEEASTETSGSLRPFVSFTRQTESQTGSINVALVGGDLPSYAYHHRPSFFFAGTTKQDLKRIVDCLQEALKDWNE